MKGLLFILLPFFIAGCSTSPIPIDQAKPVPASRVFALQQKKDSQLVVTRDSGIVGSELRFILHIDGKPAGEFHPGEVARFGLTPGKHVLGLGTWVLFGKSDIIESEIDIKPGETLRRRISIRGGDYYLTPTAY
ncbi:MULTISPECIES: hypothetical protein [Pseudomonas]|uniref:hypothetical protein n=1 Tax=Pseudomonas TaxID=286 RepID=UPI0009377202|nr:MULTISPECIES: hypothetical protein [Pseudomonas]MDH2077144.1 hypothetical protein [Pseudomonas atacamensis]OJT50067.1 hypothetical protein BSZ28_18735 [Pseudomonas moraviensis]WGT32147.1 hypothetical protein QG303_17440 [Pseudomonas atacamensis]